MSKKQFDFKTMPEQISLIGRRLRRYRVLIFIVVVAAVYGFTILRINSLDNAQPSNDAITAQSNPIGTAHVDQTVVKQMQQLQDNSVSVQALFEQARNNPFQQ